MRLALGAVRCSDAVEQAAQATFDGRTDVLLPDLDDGVAAQQEAVQVGRVELDQGQPVRRVELHDRAGPSARPVPHVAAPGPAGGGGSPSRGGGPPPRPPPPPSPLPAGARSPSSSRARAKVQVTAVPSREAVGGKSTCTASGSVEL